MLDELKQEIKYYKDRCEWQASRGRTSGTYDHMRLAQLQAAYDARKKFEAAKKAAEVKPKSVTKTKEPNDGK